MWNLTRPGFEPVSPALAGKFLTTGPSGKSWNQVCDEVGQQSSVSKEQIPPTYLISQQRVTEPLPLVYAKQIYLVC